MLEKYFNVTNLTAANIANINTDDVRSEIFKKALISYGSIRMRIKNIRDTSEESGEVVLKWDEPISPVSHYIEDWLESLLHTLKIECTCPERAATYFYHRQYSAIATKRAMAVMHPEMCDEVHPEEFDELIRMLFNELPHLYNDLK